MKSKRILKNIGLIFGAIFLACFENITAQEVEITDSIPIKYSNTINIEDLKNHLFKLASEEFEGREACEKGQKKAAEYIANHFKNIGIPPLIDNSYYQKVPMVIKKNDDIFILIDKIKYQYLKDFYCFGFDDFSITDAQVEFLGYGINSAKYNDYRDYETTDTLEGKILMMIEKEPLNVRGISYLTDNNNVSDWTLNWRRKLEQAKFFNPAAIFIIEDSLKENIKKKNHFIESSQIRLENSKKQDEFPPVFFISSELANNILSENNTNISKIKKEISRSGKPITFSVQNTINISANNRDAKNVYSENVLGYIEGTDMKNELVIITAHYDHLGIKGKKIYFGADDDASGTTALLEIAEAFTIAKKEGYAPRRSVLVMPVTAEEKGLLGSKYYTENPVFPLENTIVNLNIDMIGRVDELHIKNPDYMYIIGADKLSTELHEINEKANSTYTKLELDYTFNSPDDPNRFYYRSDHYNFAQNNIPIIFYFNGVHDDYHKPTDTVDKINFEILQKRTQLIFFTAWTLANRPQRIIVDKTPKEKRDKKK